MTGGRSAVSTAHRAALERGAGWSMGTLTAAMSLLLALSLVILVAPLGGGGRPLWEALFLTALAGFGGCYAFALARDERRARRRAGRTLPEPGAGDTRG